MIKKSLTLVSNFTPRGDQPHAIASVVAAFNRHEKFHTLLGVTGSGKTYTSAQVLASLDRSALVIAPNKTLAAQLYFEFKELFPHNAVGFFVSYYDYYQPEAYLPASDTYIAKDSAVNDDIDKMRHEATAFLAGEQRTIIVSSVSCIYGLGSPLTYGAHVLATTVGMRLKRDTFVRQLIKIQYQRNDAMLTRGCFRVRGNLVSVHRAHEHHDAWNFYFGSDSLEEITCIDALSGEINHAVAELSIFPNTHYLASDSSIKSVVTAIQRDLQVQLATLERQGHLLERQRLEERTHHDIELIEQLGFCPGIENYSRYLTGKNPGEPPPCLLDYFPKDFITIIDESHITIPQLRGMYRGDQARKKTLVDYGFRLPSALDNRPLNFDEFLARTNQVLFLSATPADYEYEMSTSASELVIRPTGLVDPPISVRPATAQVDDLYWQIKEVVAGGGRVLVTTLTKKMAQDLTTYYHELGIKVHYLHADVTTLERVELLRRLRQGIFSVLIGINLLREGLDIPEVELVAVLDADKEGFLRSRSSLIQITGRAARNQKARAIFYADSITPSMAEAIGETDRRRRKQIAYNTAHGILPQTVVKAIPDDMRMMFSALAGSPPTARKPASNFSRIAEEYRGVSQEKLRAVVRRKEKAMKKMASQMKFEEAAMLRDELAAIEVLLLAMLKE